MASTSLVRRIAPRTGAVAAALRSGVASPAAPRTASVVTPARALSSSASPLQSPLSLAPRLQAHLLARSRPAQLRASLRTTPPAAALVPFLLADVGEGIVDCSIVQWHVKVGDTISEFDKICEVQSDKAAVDISSRYSGVVRKLYYKAGENAKVGRPLVDIETGDGTPPAAAAAAHAAPTAAAPSAPAASTSSSSTGSSAEAADRLVFATPAVRRFAKETNVDLRLVVGTGRDGRILKEDVQLFLEGKQGSAAAAAPAAAVPAPPAATAPTAAPSRPSTPAAPSVRTGAPAADRREPVRPFTKAMIKVMNNSWKTIPHFGYCDELMMNNASAMRRSLKPMAEEKGIKLSYMPILIKAASLALRDFPILNSSLSSDETEILYKAAHNIGLAMDTPNGLVVPNIKDVQDKSILDIAADINALQQKGAAGKLGPADLAGGTFTLSNIGTIGGTYMKPVIVAPEVCIGAIGKIERLPRFNAAGDVYGAEVMAVSWSADHRIVDGATMARFSNRWKGYVENPSSMLLQLK